MIVNVDALKAALRLTEGMIHDGKIYVRYDRLQSALSRLQRPDGYGMADLCARAYGDALEHGFWAAEESPMYCALRIGEEVREMMDAQADPAHYAEELADVVIMAMSVAGHLGIDIEQEVQRKMDYNRRRPWRHGSDEQ